MENSNKIILKLTQNDGISREFEPEKFDKLELILSGVSNPDKLQKKLSEFINEYIDIEETEKNILDFWSDGYQIGEFEVMEFTENVSEYQKQDWINEYDLLVKKYYNEYDLNSKENRLNSKLIKKIEELIESENAKDIIKLKFLKNELRVKSINEKSKFIKRLENLKNQYLDEYKNLK